MKSVKLSGRPFVHRSQQELIEMGLDLNSMPRAVPCILSCSKFIFVLKYAGKIGHPFQYIDSSGVNRLGLGLFADIAGYRILYLTTSSLDLDKASSAILRMSYRDTTARSASYTRSYQIGGLRALILSRLGSYSVRFAVELPLLIELCCLSPTGYGGL